MSNYNFNKDSSIEVLPLSVYIINALKRARIHSLQDLEAHSIEELARIRGLGPDRIQAVVSVCEQYSIHLSLESKPDFLHSAYIHSLTHKTILLLYETKISALEEIPNHSTEELFEWFGKDILRTARVYKELKSAGIPTYTSGSPFLFEVPSFPTSSLSSLLWQGVHRMEDFLSMTTKDLQCIRNIGKKRAAQLVEFQIEYLSSHTSTS